MIVISSSHPISSSSHHLTTASARARTLPTSSARAAATRATQARAPTRCSSPPATSRCRPAPPPAAPCAVGLSDSPASPPPTLFTGHRRTAQLGAEFETVRDKFMDAPQPGTSSTHALGKVCAALRGCSSDAVCSAAVLMGALRRRQKAAAVSSALRTILHPRRPWGLIAFVVRLVACAFPLDGKALPTFVCDDTSPLDLQTAQQHKRAK